MLLRSPREFVASSSRVRSTRGGNRTDEKAIYRRADHWPALRSRCRTAGQGAVQQAWFQRTELSRLEGQARRHGHVGRTAPEVAGSREHEAHEAVGQLDARNRCNARDAQGKAVADDNGRLRIRPGPRRMPVAARVRKPPVTCAASSTSGARATTTASRTAPPDTCRRPCSPNRAASMLTTECQTPHQPQRSKPLGSRSKCYETGGCQSARMPAIDDSHR